MLKNIHCRLQHLGSMAPTTGIAALLIIAVAAVASGAGYAARAAETAAEKAADKPQDKPQERPKPGAFIWHETPRPLPATVFKDAAGAEQTLAKFTGKVLVVNFWATWCAPCVKEMPTLDALQAKLGGPAFQVLAISQDREGARVAKPFVEKNEWKNLAFYIEAPGKFARDANLRGLPTSLIIDKSGREVARVEGEVKWDSPEVEKTLRELMTKG